MVNALEIHVPAGTRAFVDSQYFDGTDAKYAIGAIRDRLLRSGVNLVGDKKDADMVIEARSGAQSIDKTSFLIGVPKPRFRSRCPAPSPSRRSLCSSVRR